MTVPSEKLGLEVFSNTRPFAPVMNIDLNSESLKIKIRPVYV